MFTLYTAAALSAALVSSLVTASPLSEREFHLSNRDTPLVNVSNSSATVALDISVNGEGRNDTAPLLYGWMIEDISVS